MRPPNVLRMARGGPFCDTATFPPSKQQCTGIQKRLLHSRYRSVQCAARVNLQEHGLRPALRLQGYSHLAAGWGLAASRGAGAVRVGSNSRGGSHIIRRRGSEEQGVHGVKQGVFSAAKIGIGRRPGVMGSRVHTPLPCAGREGGLTTESWGDGRGGREYTLGDVTGRGRERNRAGGRRARGGDMAERAPPAACCVRSALRARGRWPPAMGGGG
jgi:hypothetical protein